MKRVNLSFLFSGLVISGLGAVLFLNKDYFTFGTKMTDIRVYWGLLTLMGLVFLTGLSSVVIAFRYPSIKAYPAWFCMGAYILCAVAGYIGLVLLPEAKGNSSALTKLLIPMIILMILACLAFCAFSSTLPKEIRRVKKVKKSSFDIEEQVELIDKFTED